MKYPEKRKQAVIAKMMPPHNKSVAELAQEEQISIPTLYNWRNEARKQGRLLPKGDQTPQGWASSDKFAAVLETASMNQAELSEYCRKRGLFPEQVQQWRQACEQANDWDRKQNETLKTARKADAQRLRELERELHRKDKALAETAALLVLQKKSPGDLGGSRGRMISASDRQNALELIRNACHSGARLSKACQTLGISLRTYQRWRRSGDALYDKRPGATRGRPSFSLTEEERHEILTACNTPEFQNMAPARGKGRHDQPEGR